MKNLIKVPNYSNSTGFTLIELLVVISIIGVLASVVISSVSDARLKAQEAAALQQLRNINLGIQRLIQDTGRAPNGCSPYRTANPEVILSSNQAGLVERPNVQDNGFGCAWSALDVSRWRGPYVDEVPQDQFKRAFMYDPDYFQYLHCPTAENPGYPVIRAIVSRGADQAWYTCDDIFLEIY